MPPAGTPLEKLGFLTIGLFDEADPAGGHETTLRMIELGERLGFDSAWVRHRHLQYGISSPVAVLAAATQRTRRIELGTAVIPLGWENPLRLAEDLATVDVLSGGRLNPGVSVGPPMHWDDVKAALYPDTADAEDFSYERVLRLLRFVAGEPASSFRGTEGIEQFSDRVQPHASGLRSRLWYGGASLRSATWAGEHGMNFLTSSVVRAEESADSGDGGSTGGPPPVGSPRSSDRTSARSGPRTRPVGCRRASSSSRPTARARRSGRSTPRTWPGGRRGPPHHRARAGCCSPATWSARPSRSRRRCTRTPASRR